MSDFIDKVCNIFLGFSILFGITILVLDVIFTVTGIYK
jgi:hypothetical protein